ncbi:MAG: hypothetical protein GTN36_04220 [Candidatus Aenigmarchaeota archaeon]|nr:hypothetical protein [Candidatus Aenigmarchaeota archaeon]
MDFISAYKTTKSKIPETVKNGPLNEHIFKLPDLAVSVIVKGPKIIYENKEIVVPLTLSLVSYTVASQLGIPFLNYDKTIHFSVGYSTSRFGRKLTRKFNKEKYESLASVLMNLGLGVMREACQSRFDIFDLLGDLSGCATENLREYIGGAKKNIFKQFGKS